MATKPDPNLKAAQDLVAAMLDPTKAALEAQREQLAAEAAQRGQAIQGFAGAAAEQVAPIGGQVQAGYQDAAGRTATYSKGFSLGMQLAQQASAADINKTLAQSGAPAGQMLSPGSGAADVLYGSTGFIPASGLEREGAAFGAAAAQLPATMLGRGQQLQYESQREALKVDREYADQLEKLELERPGAIQKALLELRDLAVKERAQRLDEQIAVEKLGIDRSRLGLEAGRLKVSAANAQTARQRAQTARFNAQLRKLESDRSFQIQLKKLVPDVAGPAARTEAKKRSGGFTALQLRNLRQQAFDTARDDFEGYDPETDTADPKNRRRPVETLRDLIAAGVPFSEAIKAIQRFARSPGADKYWRATLRWTKPRPKKAK